MGEDNLYNRYTNVTAKEKEEAAYLDKLIVDIAQQSRSTTASQAPTSFNNSKAKPSTKAVETSAKMMIDTTGDKRKPSVPSNFSGSQMLTKKQVMPDKNNQ